MGLAAFVRVRTAGNSRKRRKIRTFFTIRHKARNACPRFNPALARATFNCPTTANLRGAPPAGRILKAMSSNRTRIQYALADFLPIAAVVSIGMVLSVIAFFLVRGYYIGADSQQFERDTAYYSSSFKGDVARHVNSMAAIRAFVSASHDVNRWEFSSFAHQILPQNSGFKAVLWLPHIGQPQRKAFEAGLEKDGLYGLRLRQLTQAGELVNAGARDAYLPVAYVEPFESSGSLSRLWRGNGRGTQMAARKSSPIKSGTKPPTAGSHEKA